MQGIQIKIERKEVDTQGKSFILEAMLPPSEKIQQEGMAPETEMVEVVESMYLPYEMKQPDGSRVTYFVKIDDRRLFADLTNISEEMFNARMDKAFAEGQQHYRFEELPKQLDHARYEAADRMQHWFAALPWYRRLFYSPAPLVEAAGNDEKTIEEQKGLIEQ